MKSLIYCSLLLVPACFGGERADTGKCPAGETCSDKTPQGLQFVGREFAGTTNLVGPYATAVGGTQDIQIEIEAAVGIYVPLKYGFTADDDGALGVKIDRVDGTVVSVRGMASRTNYLRIMDKDTGLLFDRHELAGAAIDRLQIISATPESVPDDLDVAFAAGNIEVGVALFGQVQTGHGPEDQRIVDDSMALDLAGGTPTTWDAIALNGAAAGTYNLGITAGDKPTANLDVVVVDALDSIQAAANNPDIVQPNGSSTVCFDGLANGRYVAQLVWHFTVDGVAPTNGALGNCVTFSTLKTTGTIEILASAMGKQATVTLPVSAARIAPPVTAVKAVPATAGERAAM